MLAPPARSTKDWRHQLCHGFNDLIGQSNDWECGSILSQLRKWPSSPSTQSSPERCSSHCGCLFSPSRIIFRTTATTADSRCGSSCPLCSHSVPSDSFKKSHIPRTIAPSPPAHDPIETNPALGQQFVEPAPHHALQEREFVVVVVIKRSPVQRGRIRNILHGNVFQTLFLQ